MLVRSIEDSRVGLGAPRRRYRRGTGLSPRGRRNPPNRTERQRLKPSPEPLHLGQGRALLESPHRDGSRDHPIGS